MVNVFTLQNLIKRKIVLLNDHLQISADYKQHKLSITSIAGDENWPAGASYFMGGSM